VRLHRQGRCEYALLDTESDVAACQALELGCKCLVEEQTYRQMAEDFGDVALQQDRDADKLLDTRS
jgi:hypothetical protein